VARKIFFSFHYERDAWRAGQVRNSNVVSSDDRYGFVDASDWESIKKKGDAAVEGWINDQLKNTSVTVVLIGAETASRDWVQYEILKSWNRGNGIVGVRIHNIKDQDQKTDVAGHNPLDDFKLSDGTVLSSVCKTYDWVIDDGRKKLGGWADEAANIRAKYGTEDTVAKAGKDTARSLLRSSAGSAGLSFPSKPIVPNKPAGFA
jgi:hypothetical protein